MLGASQAQAADPTPYWPGNGANIRVETTFSFEAEDTTPGTSELYVSVSSSPVTDGSGLVGTDQGFITLDPVPGDPTYFTASVTVSPAGTYYWTVDNCTSGPPCADVSAVQTLTISNPPQHSELIPASTGASRVDAYHFNYFYLNPASPPSGVGLTRFEQLATRSAARWGISYRGRTGNAFNKPDGVPSVGFSHAVPATALGVQTTWTEKVFKKKRRCRRTPRGRRCRKVRKYVGTKIVDQDIGFSYNFTWEDGPQYPAVDEFDLESTVIHEFGHFASDAVHTHGCSNSPMIISSAPGDWWHGTNDWERSGCASPGPQAALPSPGRVRFREIVRQVPPGWKPPPNADLPRVRPAPGR